MTSVHLILAMLTVLGAGLLAAQHPAMPAGMSHEEHLRHIKKDDELKQRGGPAMGFDKDKTFTISCSSR